MITRAAIVAEARSWIGTPYRHQASLKGAGADCLGLVRGVWRALVGPEPEIPPAYAPDWAEAAGQETLLEAARRHLIEIERESIEPGDVLLFRMRMGGPAKHAAVLTEPLRMVHALSGWEVMEVAFDRAWQRRLAFTFRFPGCAG